MSEEVLDIVDEKDQVVGQATHRQVHEKKLLHRVVVALLFNDAGEILLQLRAKDKSTYPSHWSFSMGGHVRHGETYLQGLVREGKEEVGIIFFQKDFDFKGRGFVTESSGTQVIYELYTVSYDGPIEEKTEEVDAVQFVTWKTLREMIVKEKEKLHPQLVVALKMYFAKELGL